MTKGDFLHQLGHAPPGRWIMYHEGYLPVDREKNGKLNALAYVIYEVQEGGNVLFGPT